jgi:MFS family permease
LFVADETKGAIAKATIAERQREITSPWSPLRHATFRALWIAAWASNVGTWMQDVGGSWLMTSMTKSAIMIALVQTATSFPLFMLSVPAGALADIVDRRKILLVTQAWMLLFAGLLGILTLVGITGPWLLLLLTFGLAIGGALNAPAWQATVPELVPRNELSAAVALNSGSLNLARAIGPAIGGLIVSTFGPGAVFILNAFSFLGVIWVIYRWRSVPSEAFAPTERVIGASRAGLRYVRHAPALRAVLVRTGVFMLGGSAFWALLPAVGRYVLKLDSVGYGLLLGSFGAGAVLGAFTIEGARRYASSDVMAFGATIIFAGTTAALGLIGNVHVLYATMALGGVAWIGMMSTMNVAAQLASPAWVRARALAVYLLVFYGFMALGSAFWGTIATTFSTSSALMAASAILLAGLISARYFPLRIEARQDLTPSMHWPEPHLAVEPDLEAGPVLITVEYRIDPVQEREFLRAMRVVGRARRRDGAIRWNVYQDVSDPERYVETFVVESWGEHLRQHARVTVADQGPEKAAREFHIGPVRPVITHLISALRRPRTE